MRTTGGEVIDGDTKRLVVVNIGVGAPRPKSGIWDATHAGHSSKGVVSEEGTIWELHDVEKKPDKR